MITPRTRSYNPYAAGLYQRIERLVSGVNPYDEEARLNPCIEEAIETTAKLACVFENTHHVIKQNLHATESSLDLYRLIGGNLLYLTNPYITLPYYNEATGEESDISMSLEAEIIVRYISLELGCTRDNINNRLYFGPLLIAELKLREDFEHPELTLPAGPYQIQVPFPAVYVPDHQPSFQLN